MVKSTSLNIAILPNEELTNQAIRFSQLTENKLTTYFVLNNTTLLPHITMYQAHFPEKNLQKVITSVRHVAQTILPFSVDMDIFSIEYETFLFWQCIKTDQLHNFHINIVHAINELREDLVLPHLSQITGLSDEDNQDMQKYGALLIGDRYHPHITITRIKNPMDGAKALDITGERKKMRFQVNNIVIGHLGNHGTVHDVIERIPLG